MPSKTPQGRGRKFILRLDHKLALIFCLFAVLVSGATAFSFYQTARRQVMEDVRRRLYDIVAVARQVIDVQTHAALKDPSQEGSPEYLAVKKALQKVRDASTDIYFIYTMRSGPSGEIVFVVDAEENPEDIAHLGQTYDEPSDTLKARFKGLAEPLVEKSYYTDEWGTWLSGYAPFFHPDGSRAGVLGVDISVKTVKAYERKLLNLSLTIFALILPLITLIGFFIGRRIARPILTIKQGAERIGGDDLDMRIDLDRSDEIGALAESFNEMTAKLKDSRSRLNEMIEKYRSIFENAIEGIFQTTADGRFVAVNPSLARILGYDSSEELEEQITSIEAQVYADPEDRPRLLAQLEENGRAANFETRLKRKDGSVVWVEMNAQKLEDPEGRPLIEGMVQDITARKSREEAERERRAAEAASQAKSDFLANMSHEIRTPLNAVMGLTDLLRKTELTPRQLGYIQKISASGRSLLAVINDILDLSKIEAGRLELEEADFSLYEVMANISEMFAQRAHEKEIELLVSIDENVPCALIGDQVRLGQVLINLTGNAIKFTEAGEIVVSVRPAAQDDQLDEDLVRLEFSVADTGAGIPPDRLEKIFDSFTQADSSTTRRHGGTGLGLTISRQITAMMSGELKVESVVGQGSRFYFDAVFRRQPPEKDIRPLPPGDLRGLRVLIVDDNQTSLEILASFITSFQMEAVTASSGAEAVDLVQAASEPFDLILMDWRMPELSGLETARRIKHGLKLEKLPIICMVSAYGREDLLQQSEKALLDAFLHKPVNQSFLFDTIMELFGREGRIMTGAVDPGQGKLEAVAPPAGTRILLVEDNEINREIAREWLESAGLTVHEAENGQEALDRLEAENFDAVLMDVQMPVLDGLEATRLARRKEELQNLPIIAMTAHALKGDRERCLEAGMNDYLTKPIDPRKLMSVLSSWIGSPGPVRTIENDAPAETLSLDVPGLDASVGLYRANNKVGLYLKLLRTFVKDFSGADDEIVRLLEAGDQDGAGRLAHSIKGVSLNIGAGRLGELAAGAEVKLSRGEYDSGADWWKDFSAELRAVLADLSEALSEETSPQGAPPAAKEPEMDRAQLLKRLRELASALDEDLDQARTILNELQPPLSSVGGEESAGIIEAVDDFDIDGAGELLDNLIGRLEAEEG